MMIFFLFLCCVATTYGATYMELAKITNPKLLKQGYSCLPTKPNIGPMYNGQIANQYDKSFCERAICHDGFVEYQTCGTASYFGPSNCKLVEDLTKPYPECCKKPKCF